MVGASWDVRNGFAAHEALGDRAALSDHRIGRFLLVRFANGLRISLVGALRILAIFSADSARVTVYEYISTLVLFALLHLVMQPFLADSCNRKAAE